MKCVRINPQLKRGSVNLLVMRKLQALEGPQVSILSVVFDCACCLLGPSSPVGQVDYRSVARTKVPQLSVAR